LFPLGSTSANPTSDIDFDVFQKFSANHEVVVCGSTWLEDEKIICQHIYHKDLDHKYIIAPHEIDEEHLTKLEHLIDVKYMRYSFATKAGRRELADVQVLIIDNIGMLSSLYQFGKIAYIGGGFGKGIHNTLEPAAFGLPIIFGPKYTKFMEAVALVKKSGAFCIQNETDYVKILVELSKPSVYAQASAQVNAYMNGNKGATNKIMDYLVDG
jgi:3-deoxy-D-manno-octulosonic-acid transferase